MEIPTPDAAARRAILQVQTRHMPLGKDVDIEMLVKSTEGLVGADLEGLCRQAALFAIREIVIPAEPADAALHKLTVTKRHFEMALAKRNASRNQP